MNEEEQEMTQLDPDDLPLEEFKTAFIEAYGNQIGREMFIDTLLVEVYETLTHMMIYPLAEDVADIRRKWLKWRTQQ